MTLRVRIWLRNALVSVLRDAAVSYCARVDLRVPTSA